jgi:two-component system cell cycle response regulator
MKILLAEDDPVSRVLMQRTLQKFGYEVVLAEDGRTAADILTARDAPRLALIDWMMPELDGLGVCREVRGCHRDGSYVFILLLTSKQNSEDVVAGLEAGADDYITKPCQPAELRARLRTGRRILSLEEKLVEAREEMRFKATHDALTGLWNRASILSFLHNELERSNREHKPVSMLLCDVDHFKGINDRHGHLIGDIVLQEVARRLTSAVRGYDAVGRYGGEEFLILLSDCDATGLESRAEHIRTSIASSPIRTDADALPVSISIGAATCEEWDASIPVERILARADHALYRAKAEGRNRTVVTEPFSALVRSIQ